MSSTENKPEPSDDKYRFTSTEDDGLSAVNVLNCASKNHRVATRYVRDDIVVALCEITPLSFGKEIFIDFVKLNDITSRGISFLSTRYVTVQKKVVLNLRFHSEKTFKIHATIMYRINRSPYQYGVKFDNDHLELSDHLLETQLKLIFK